MAIYTLGCLIGALASTSVGNPLGRRRALVIFAAIAAIGTILQGTAFSLAQLIIGRITSGIGVGGVNAIVPVWQAECSKPKNRGKNVVVLGVFVASGIALAAWVNVGLSFKQSSSVCWRLPLSFPLVFCIPICMGVFCFPESPRWLVQKGRRDEARVVMQILHDLPAHSDIVDEEISIMHRVCTAEMSREVGFLDLFKPGRERLPYRAFLAVTINFCAQMTGMHYSGTGLTRVILTDIFRCQRYHVLCFDHLQRISWFRFSTIVITGCRPLIMENPSSVSRISLRGSCRSKTPLHHRRRWNGLFDDVPRYHSLSDRA